MERLRKGVEVVTNLSALALFSNAHLCIHSYAVDYEWDEAKARANLRGHRADFAGAGTTFASSPLERPLKRSIEITT